MEKNHFGRPKWVFLKPLSENEIVARKQNSEGNFTSACRNLLLRNVMTTIERTLCPSIIQNLKECCGPTVGFRGFDIKEAPDGTIAFINRNKNLIWSEAPIEDPQETLSYLNLRNQTYWYVDERDTNSAAKLTAADFGSPYAVYEMVLALENYVPVQQNPAIEIQLVNNETELHAWSRTATGSNLAGYPLLDDFVTALYYKDPKKYLFITGNIGGKAVSAAMLMFGNSSAGLYFVNTLEDARKQGAATAVSSFAIKKAFSFNYKYIILSSTQMAFSLYKNLGFSISRTFFEYSRKMLF